MKLKAIVAATALTIMAGCTAITPVEKQYSGFLQDYSDLKEVKMADGSEAMRWVNPDIVHGKYKKVIVPQVVYFPEPKTGAQVKPETLTKISDYLTQQARAELGKDFDVVDSAGPDTLKFQIAITGVSTPVEGLKVYEVVPIALVFAGATTALGYRDHVTVVYVEGLVTDSQSGDVLVKAVRQGVGENLKDEKQQLDVKAVKKVLDGWAVEARNVAQKVF